MLLRILLGVFHRISRGINKSSSCTPFVPQDPTRRFKHSRNVKMKETAARPLLYREEDVVEQFVRGGGSGGQSVAKTSNCCILKHVPTGVIVRCHKTRSRDLNRRIARQELQLRLDELVNGHESVRALREAKKLKRAKKAQQRSKAKYAAQGPKSKPSQHLQKGGPAPRASEVVRPGLDRTTPAHSAQLSAAAAQLACTHHYWPFSIAVHWVRLYRPMLACKLLPKRGTGR